MTLFEDQLPDSAPLAARMRPRNLDDFIGQEHLVGPEGALTKLLAQGHVPSLLLWGPPGSGKTTLARLLIAAVGAESRQLSAVSAGVADVRKVIAEAKAVRQAGGRMILSLDEAQPIQQ